MWWWRDRERGVYMCKNGFHNSIGEKYMDDFITGIVLERLRQPDIGSLLPTDNGSAEFAEAQAHVEELQRRLDDATTSMIAGEISATTLGRIEHSLIPLIQEAKRSVRVVSVPAAARSLFANDDPVAAWEALSLEDKVRVIRSLMSITVRRSTRPRGSRGFDVDRVTVEWLHS